MNYSKKEILKFVDHTLLNPTSTSMEVAKIVEDAVEYGAASVCIAPSFVKFSQKISNGKIPICTVIGFPNGYSTTKSKMYEAEDAILNGADEIDMVINLGFVKDKKYASVLDEIKEIKKVCQDRILKVIIETCCLDDLEKIELCKVVSNSGADFIKTSTGFGKGGAKAEDIKLFKQNLDPRVKIKASGGIKDFEKAQEFIKLGCTRLGTSSLIKCLKEE